jgi:hypothetical protein
MTRQQRALARMPLTDSVARLARRLVWTGRLRPSAASETYLVRVEYEVGRTPKVTVLEPDLRDDDIEALPHVYAGDVLCLHYPGQWRDDDLITETILPWTSEWLLHFEFFKIDGIWHGGGHEPAVAPR